MNQTKQWWNSDNVRAGRVPSQLHSCLCFGRHCCWSMRPRRAARARSLLVVVTFTILDDPIACNSQDHTSTNRPRNSIYTQLYLHLSCLILPQWQNYVHSQSSVSYLISLRYSLPFTISPISVSPLNHTAPCYHNAFAFHITRITRRTSVVDNIQGSEHRGAFYFYFRFSGFIQYTIDFDALYTMVAS